MPHTSLIPAHELVTTEGRPRKLRCRGLLLSELALQHGMRFDGRDGEVANFTPLSRLIDSDDGISVTYLASVRFADLLPQRNDVAVVTHAELRGCLREDNAALIVNGDPHDWFFTTLAAAVESGYFERLQGFISPGAKIHKTAIVEDNVHIEAGAVIGAYTVVLANAYIGREVVIKPNATVGADGFENAVIRGRHTLVPHAGGVWLSEGVRFGTSCVDRGLFGDFTFAGPYTTIDNLVHFGHSVRVGKNCALTACSEISGSTVLGDGVWLGPNSTVNQNLTIGDHCYIGTGSVVTRDLPPHSLAYGSPAKVAAIVCTCRNKLHFETGLARCTACGKHYRLDDAGQVRRA
jgi:UDP-3-O-[3-hydroxymyristoyl] glucosamine N-acyltransferase